MATDDHMKIEALGLPPGGEIMNFGRFNLENGFSIDEVVVGYTTYGTLNEVHVASPHNPYSCGLQAAEDVVIDMLLLAQCAAVVHADSNVTTAVSYASPTLVMMHVADLLSSESAHHLEGAARDEGSAEARRSAARPPAAFVQRGYLAGQRGPE